MEHSRSYWAEVGMYFAKLKVIGSKFPVLAGKFQSSWRKNAFLSHFFGPKLRIGLGGQPSGYIILAPSKNLIFPYTKKKLHYKLWVCILTEGLFKEEFKICFGAGAPHRTQRAQIPTAPKGSIFSKTLLLKLVVKDAPLDRGVGG